MLCRWLSISNMMAMQTQKDLASVYKLSSSCHPSLIIGKTCYQFFHSLFVQIMTSARTTAVRYIECDFFIQQSCYETTCGLGWIIEHYLLIPTCMISLLDQFLALCTHDCGIDSGSPGLLIFVLYLETVMVSLGPNCVCIYVSLSYTY